jgi:hypothetical protein
MLLRRDYIHLNNPVGCIRIGASEPRPRMRVSPARHSPFYPVESKGMRSVVHRSIRFDPFDKATPLAG